MRIYSKRELFSRDFQKLLEFVHKKGYGITMGEGYRTAEQQEIHRKAGRSKVKISQHQKRLAHDIFIWNKTDGETEISDSEWKIVGSYWLSLSPENRWGGNYSVPQSQRTTAVFIGTGLGWDRWHFERRG